MKLQLKGILVVLLWMTMVSVQAESTKIGVVNVGLLLEKSPQAIAASKNLEKEFSPQQDQLKTMALALEAKQKELQKNQLVMTEAQKQSSQREIGMLARDLQRKRDDIQEMVNIRRNEALVTLQKLVNQVIQQVGKSEGFDLILYEGIAYSSGQLDITQSVLTQLEKVHQNKLSNFNN